MLHNCIVQFTGEQNYHSPGNKIINVVVENSEAVNDSDRK